MIPAAHSPLACAEAFAYASNPICCKNATSRIIGRCEKHRRIWVVTTLLSSPTCRFSTCIIRRIYAALRNTTLRGYRCQTRIEATESVSERAARRDAFAAQALTRRRRPQRCGHTRTAERPRRGATRCVRVQSAERTCKRAVRGWLRTGAFEEANPGRSVAERSPSALAARSRGTDNGAYK